jgi:uncharacterized protein YifE (UPF0438 family)
MLSSTLEQHVVAVTNQRKPQTKVAEKNILSKYPRLVKQQTRLTLQGIQQNQVLRH